MSDFVDPHVDRLPLSQGRYIDVKRRLNAGERRRAFAAMARDITPGEKFTLDPERVGIAKLVQYIVGWSMTGTNGPVPVSEAAIDNLDPDLYDEIVAAVDEHERRVAQALEQERKNLSGANGLNPTSPSVAP